MTNTSHTAVNKSLYDEPADLQDWLFLPTPLNLPEPSQRYSDEQVGAAMFLNLGFWILL